MAFSEWNKVSGENLKADLDIFLRELCVRWGFCNELSGEDLLRRNPTLTSVEFANAILSAEGMKADQSDWHQSIEQLFMGRYGKFISETAFKTLQV
jgi:hypothetical protein